MPEAAFEKFAQFFGNSQIHPDDQERYMQEIEFCHGPMFEQNLRRHSVFSRMFRPTAGEYQLHEFVTFRLEPDTDDEKRNVILLCRPVKAEQPDSGILSNGVLETRLLYDVLGKTLHCKRDESLTIIGGVSSIQELTVYTAKDIEENFGGCLMELIHLKDRSRAIQELDEHLAYSDTVEVEFRISTRDNHEIWVMACCHRVVGDNGESSLYCFLIESTQVREMLENALKRFKKRIQKNESIFQIVSYHFDRFPYEYDILTGITRPWNSEDGEPRWYHFRYSSIFDGSKPVTAIISVEDISERHEQELIYQHFVHSQETEENRQLLCIESDLTADRIEKIYGQMMYLLPVDFEKELPAFAAWRLAAGFGLSD